MMLTVPLTQALGGLMLLIAFAMLSQRRLSALITLYQLQAFALAGETFWQGYARPSGDLVLTGVLTLILKAIILPLTLRRIVIRFGMVRATDQALSVGPALIIGVALVTIAILPVLPITSSVAALTREDIALAIAIILIGLLVMVTRHNALAQIIGFLAMENGLVLGLAGMPGLPFMAEFSTALLVLLAVVVFGVLLFRLREHAGSLDLDLFESIEKSGL
ncbi:MAG TPA: hydrogenase-4 component E [Acetobacteraceae bacterium]|nr:hydrogenase-4 component E [Acetobacteraceae bacterium]HQU02182.1 hydrogenase-4 component E [Acetobacteraceae bacterium]